MKFHDWVDSKIIISYKQLVVYTVYLTGANAIIPFHSGNSYTRNFATSEDTDEMHHLVKVQNSSDNSSL